MSSPFDAIDADMQSAIDAAFGSVVTIRPMAGGNYSLAADPSRPVRVNVPATVAIAQGVKTTDFNNSNRDGAPVTRRQSEIWIDRLAYAALGYELRRDDQIITGQGSFAVASTQPGDNGDVRVVLAG